MVTVPTQTLDEGRSKRVSLVMSEFMVDDLKQVSQETGSSKSDIIRHSVDLFLDAYCAKFSEDIEFSKDDEVPHV